jgi:hypothetical protein
MYSVIFNIYKEFKAFGPAKVTKAEEVEIAAILVSELNFLTMLGKAMYTYGNREITIENQ